MQLDGVVGFVCFDVRFSGQICVVFTGYFSSDLTTLDLNGSKFARSDMCFVKMVLLFSPRSLLFLFDCLMCRKKKKQTDHTTLNRAS